MTISEYDRHDATGLAELVRDKKVSAAELLEEAISRAEAVASKLNAIGTPMHAIARARASQALAGPFAGVPFLIKDIAQDYAGVRSTSGSRALAGYLPKVHSRVVERFLEAGLVVFGKTNTPELALKGITESALFGPTRNPYDLARTPGGSSGGAAAMVAARVVPMAGASDGGGSIRIPASFCGLFGLKPSRGLVDNGPALGEVWEGASSEHVLSLSVRDSARALDCLAGDGVGAPFRVASRPGSYEREASQAPGKLRVGFTTRSPLGTPVDAECVRAVTETAKLLERLGHHVDEKQPEVDGLALARSFMTMYFGQVAANVAAAKKLTGASERDFELDTRALALLGRSISAGDYVTAHWTWNDFARALGRFHERHDLFLSPTVAMPPAKIGELELPAAQRVLLRGVLKIGAGKALIKSGIVDQLATENLKRTPFTQLSNLTGTPSMSVPLHWGAGGLPVGVQFVARFGEEAMLLRLATQLERERPWKDRRPTL